MTNFAALNGARVISAKVVIPFRGMWSADVVLASDQIIPATALTLQVGNLSLIGTSYRMASFAGSRSVRMVAGAGGWRKPLPSQGYYNQNGVRATTVVGDAAAAVGELVNVSPTLTLGNVFVREAAPAQRVLRQVLGTSWWIDNTGVLQGSDRTLSNPITSQFTVVGWSGARGEFEVATEDVASWVPGRTFSAPTVSNVQSISLSSIEVDNEGVLRVHVLSQGADNEL